MDPPRSPQDDQHLDDQHLDDLHLDDQLLDDQLCGSHCLNSIDQLDQPLAVRRSERSSLAVAIMVTGYHNAAFN